MKWKLGFTALATSLFLIHPLDAARQLDKSMQNPRTLSDTSSMLQEMHGQMKLMQEQLGTLKASQQLLSAENAIKHLTPKVRKLEVHLERLEKQMSQSASLEEISQIKNDLFDMKTKLSALISAPDSSVDAALNALNPTLERMQKQVYYLYETVKTNSEKQEQDVQDKLTKLVSKLGLFEEDVSKKIDDLQATGSSLLLIRQALQQNHNVINTLKIDLETLKNEKMNEIFNQLEQVKVQANQDELIHKMAYMKQQIQKLAQVFKKSITSVESTSQLSEKNLELTNQLGQKVSDIETLQSKHANSMRVLYQRGENLKNQLDLVKTVTEQNYQDSLNKAEQLLARYPVERFSETLKVLADNYNIVADQIEDLKKEYGLSEAETKFLFSSIQERLTEIQTLQDYAKQNRKRINFLYEKTKELITRKDLEIFQEYQAVEAKKIDELMLGFEMQNSRLAEFSEIKPQLVLQGEFQSLKESFGSEQEKVASLEQQLANCYQSLHEVGLASQKLQEEYKICTLLEHSISQQQDMIEKLRKQTTLLYKQMKESNPVREIENLKNQLRELGGKVESLDATLSKNYDDRQNSNEFESKLTSLESQIQGLYDKIDEKDEVIAKLSRRVAFLTKSLKEKLDTPSQSNDDLSVFKQEMRDRIEEELKAIQNDRMVFETLIQRVAALEASIATDETAMDLSDH